METQSPFSLLGRVSGTASQLLSKLAPPDWLVHEMQRRLVLLLNHVVYPFLGTLCPWITPVPLPVQYWTALGWIICGLFGKKVGDKYVARGAAPEAQDGNGNQPQD